MSKKQKEITGWLSVQMIKSVGWEEGRVYKTKEAAERWGADYEWKFREPFLENTIYEGHLIRARREPIKISIVFADEGK